MRVVIVGKTNMHGGICVGGLVEATAQSVRLIPKGQLCNPWNTPYELGDIWELVTAPRRDATAPHTEDHDVKRPGRRIGRVADLNEWLRDRIQPWTGSRAAIFDGTAQFRANGTAYVPEQGPLPDHSTGFWILPSQFSYRPFVTQDSEKPYYELRGISPVRVKYVGLLPTTDLPQNLPAGTLVRLSLAHTWPDAPNPDDRDKFFVQLSGWYI